MPGALELRIDSLARCLRNQLNRRLPQLNLDCCGPNPPNNRCRADNSIKRCSDDCAAAIGQLKRDCDDVLHHTPQGIAVNTLLAAQVAAGGCHGHGSGH